MKRACSIVMAMIMEHCDDKGHGAFSLKGSWIIVMTMIMEHCDERHQGAL